MDWPDPARAVVDVIRGADGDGSHGGTRDREVQVGIAAAAPTGAGGRRAADGRCAGAGPAHRNVAACRSRCRGTCAGALRGRDDVPSARLAPVGRERRRIRGPGRAAPPLHRAERSALPCRPAGGRPHGRPGRRPMVSARSRGRGAVVDRCRNRVEPYDRQSGHRRGGNRHGRALRPSGSACARRSAAICCRVTT